MGKMSERITLKDIYDVTNRLEDKLDNRLKEIEREVEKNANFRERSMAIMGVVSAVIATLFSILANRLL